MDYIALKSELTVDPLTRGYAGMSNQEAADSLNNADSPDTRQVNRTVMTGKEVKDRIDVTEWNARTDAQKQLVLAMCNRDDLDPFGIDAQIFQDAMTGATNTLAALVAYRVQDVSRAVELGLGVVTQWDVDSARRATV